MNKNVNIGSKTIGNDSPTYIIAEAGVNHNGKLDIALQLVRNAKDIGADCIKFQTFKAGDVVTRNAPKADYQLKVTDKAESQYDMLKGLELDFDSYKKIIEECNKNEIDFLSTPYNKSDVDFLMNLEVSAFKVASGQLIELNFLRYLGKQNLPIILSTGMASLSEVAKAVEVIRETGNYKIIVLQCVTNYPASLVDVNLNAMITMGRALDTLFGYSDHVPENYAAFAAVALGAKIVEKHFTLDTNMHGPDHSSSLDLEKFKELIVGIRSVESALGKSNKAPSDIEVKNSKGMRRSIVFKEDLEKGTVLTQDNLTFKRPATGIKPEFMETFLGKKLNVGVKKDEMLEFKHINW